MFKNLGAPSLFMTLSANDMHWSELIMTLKKCSYEEACTIKNALSLVKEDPYLTALHFERRFKALLHHVINGKLAPLGKVIDYFCRVEFQNRGSPHMHIFFWIENFKTIYNNREKLLAYINATISTKAPIDNLYLASLIRKYQTHGHSNYCLHKTGRCRFGFPYKPCNHTKLVSNLDVVSDRQKCKFYETARNSSDAYINAYNPTILLHWQANMDIQVIGNAESAAYYVCAYLCKSEPEDLKDSLSELISNIPDGTTQRQRLMKIGCCVLKTRKMSAQEAAYRLSDLHLISTSRTVLSLNVKPPE